jgi:hypothetical protein
MSRSVRRAREAVEAEKSREVPRVLELRAALDRLDRAERRSARRREGRDLDRELDRLLADLATLAARAHGRRRRPPRLAAVVEALDAAERAIRAALRGEGRAS